MTDVYLVAGIRTPFVKAGGVFARHNAIALSLPVVRAMNARTAPDVMIWGQVIPDATVSNIARELIFEAGLSPDIPAFSTVMACSTSFVGTIAAAGMVGHGDFHLALVGGVETMSHVPLALKPQFADTVFGQFAKNPTGALETLQKVTPQDFDLPIHGWANRQSGRSMGEHTEDHRQALCDRARRSGQARAAQPPGRHRGSGCGLLQGSCGRVRRRRSRHDRAPRYLARKTGGPEAGLRPQRAGHADGRQLHAQHRWRRGDLGRGRRRRRRIPPIAARRPASISILARFPGTA